jgi:hypothetical protein
MEIMRLRHAKIFNSPPRVFSIVPGIPKSALILAPSKGKQYSCVLFNASSKVGTILFVPVKF